jgi:hypothetical protein
LISGVVYEAAQDRYTKREAVTWLDILAEIGGIIEIIAILTFFLVGST